MPVEEQTAAAVRQTITLQLKGQTGKQSGSPGLDQVPASLQTAPSSQQVQVLLITRWYRS